MSTADATPRPADASRRTFRQLMTEPVLGPLLRSRFCSIGCSIIGVSQVWSALAQVTVWQCPMRSLLGVPCPGCGLSGASAALFQGRWSEMTHLHVFAPLFMLALAAFLVASVLPSRARDAFADQALRIEKRLPIGPVLLVLVVVYWLARMMLSVI